MKERLFFFSQFNLTPRNIEIKLRIFKKLECDFFILKEVIKNIQRLLKSEIFQKHLGYAQKNQVHYVVFLIHFSYLL